MRGESFHTLVLEASLHHLSDLPAPLPDLDPHTAAEIIGDAIGTGTARLDLDEGEVRLTRRGRQLVSCLTRHHQSATRPVPASAPSWIDETSDAIEREHRLVAAIETALTEALRCHRRMEGTCPLLAAGHGPAACAALDTLAPGQMGRLEPIDDTEIPPADRDRLVVLGLVAGLPVSVHDRCSDGTVLIRTGRGLVEVAPSLACKVRLTLGDLDAIADHLAHHRPMSERTAPPR